MKTNKNKSIIIKIKGKDHYFQARVPLWKAYLILADIEKNALDKKLKDK